jgi:hypothetical protein
MPPFRVCLLICAMTALSPAAPALAQRGPGGFGRPYGGGWGDRSWRDDRVATQAGAEPSRHIDVETFRAADALGLLGRGRIVVTDGGAPAGLTPPPPPPSAPPAPGDAPMAPANDPDADVAAKMPVYEAAVIDQLAGKGYDVEHADDPGQLVEIAVSRDVVIPEEAPHKPVSGEMSVGVSNFGMGYGMAIAVDLSKPRKAIIATQLDVRIRDRATRRVLWEGHAQGQARATDEGGDTARIAGRLATALFARFPEATVVAAMPGADRLGPAEAVGE